MELAKICVKAISASENAGAKVHGIISDGASTNKTMWSKLGEFGCKADLHETRNWFTHPLFPGRKVFVFSDTPHVFKNIRNRLLTHHQLQVNVKFN